MVLKYSELGFTPDRLHKNTDGTFVTPAFVIMMGGYMYWTMLPQWRLAIEALQRISKLIYFVKGDGGGGGGGGGG